MCMITQQSRSSSRQAVMVLLEVYHVVISRADNYSKLYMRSIARSCWASTNDARASTLECSIV